MKFAVDDLTAGVTRKPTAVLPAVLFVIALVGGVFRFLMRKVVIGVSRHMEPTSNDFFRHLQRLPPAFYQDHRTGDLMSRATNDLNAVHDGRPFGDVRDPDHAGLRRRHHRRSRSIRGTTVFALLPLPLSVSVKVFGTAIHRRFERIQEQLSELSAVAQENLSGVRIVRAVQGAPSS